MLKNLTTSFKPWVIPSVSGAIFCLLVISLNFLLKGAKGWGPLEIDYSVHLFCTRPFYNLTHMDAVAFFGSSLVFWVTEAILLLIFFPKPDPERPLRKSFSNITRFIGAGFFMYFLLVVFCCWALAIYEGYVSQIFDHHYMNHGPWHFVSHLKSLTIISCGSLFFSLIFACLSFLIRFNKQALMLIFLDIICFYLFIIFQVGLID